MLINAYVRSVVEDSLWRVSMCDPEILTGPLSLGV